MFAEDFYRARVAALSVSVSMLFSPETKGTKMGSDIQLHDRTARSSTTVRASGQGRSFRDKDRTGECFHKLKSCILGLAQ
jgi:hypothetical protein